MGGVSRDEYEPVEGRRAAGRATRRRRAVLALLVLLTALLAAGLVAAAGYLGWYVHGLRPAPTNGTAGTNHSDSSTTTEDGETYPPVVGDAELLAVTASMWTLAQPAMLTAGTDYILNLGGQVNGSVRDDLAPHRLFQAVNVDVRRWTATSQMFVRLLDNYNYVTKVQETYTDADLTEIDDFLDAILGRPVMRRLGTFLRDNGFTGPGKAEYRELIREVWFGLYSRSPKYNISDSSGFEHVFVGEIRKNKVIGFHSWIHFYLQEAAGLVDYQGYYSYHQPYLINVRLRWHDKMKNMASFFVGTPPEYDVAVYSLCLIARTGAQCPIYVNGHEVHIESWEVKHKAGLQVASTYTAI